MLKSQNNGISQNVSDEELDNARHEVEFCTKQFAKLIPSLIQIGQEAFKSETDYEAVRQKVKAEVWKNNLRIH